MQISKELILYDSPISELYELHAPALFAFLLQRIKSREDAEDVLVEIFVAAIEYQKLPLLNEKEQKAWLWRVARNKMVDAYRYARIRQGINLDTVATTIYEDDERAPEQVILRREEYTLLRTYLEKLPLIQQQAMRLRFANDLRYAEIAEILGKREATIRVMLSRALNLLRTIYANDQKETAHDR